MNILAVSNSVFPFRCHNIVFHWYFNLTIDSIGTVLDPPSDLVEQFRHLRHVRCLLFFVLFGPRRDSQFPEKATNSADF